LGAAEGVEAPMLEKLGALFIGDKAHAVGLLFYDRGLREGRA
jgi:hypothetical protein